jgi:alpha/beta superfamily hydrolase
MFTTTRLFHLAVSLVAIHVIDDNFLHPPPGTSAGDHLVSGLVPLALLALAAWAFPRLRGTGRGLLALFLGPFGVAAGIEAVYYTREVGPSGDDFTGLLAIPAGLLLIGLGLVTLWRTRRTEGSLWWRYPRRGLIAAGAAVVAGLVIFPIGFSYVITHTARAEVPKAALGAAHEDVSFKTSDGLTLRGWYVPSKNGAAVISFPGRAGTQKQARMLIRHGYGVLLFDRRGEGESDGAPNAYGWGGDRDIKAAVAYLQRRSDVDPGRIGGIGRSVGGELMLEAAAETDALKAVVSEGAGARIAGEMLDSDMAGPADAPALTLKDVALALFSNEAPPRHLKDLSAEIEQPALLIGAPNSKHGEELNRMYDRAAGDNVELWEIPESGHVGGIDARPQEYERRVVGFFGGALR